MTWIDPAMALLLAGHLWCAGTAVFAPCFSIVCEIAEARGKREFGALGRCQARWGLIALIMSGIIGLVYGACIWNGNLSHALSRLQSRVFFGTIEWFFSLFLVLVCLVWWHRRPNAKRVERGLRITTLLIAASNLAYHFPAFFEVLTRLRVEGQRQGQSVSSSEFRELLLRPRVISQIVHFWLASVLAGLSMLTLVVRSAVGDAGHRLNKCLQSWIGFAIVFTTAAQLVVGVWVAANVPTAMQYRLTEPSSILSWVFLFAVFVALGLIPHGVLMWLGPQRKSLSVHIVFHIGSVFLFMALLTRLLKE